MAQLNDLEASLSRISQVRGMWADVEALIDLAGEDPDRHAFSKVPSIVVSDSNCAEALTFENMPQAAYILKSILHSGFR